MSINKSVSASWTRHPLVILGGVVLAACVLGAIQAGPQKEIRTQRIVLTDEHGVDRAKLFVDDTGATVMYFLDEQGRASIVLAAEKKGNGSLNFYKTDGKPRFTLTTVEDNATIFLTAREKELMISNDDNSGPSLLMAGKGNEVRVSIGYPADNHALVTVWGDKGNGSVAMYGLADGTPLLQLKNAKDEVLFEQPVPEKAPNRPEPIRADNVPR